jgi:Rrf2 family transcriptional regulator, iron-sulfur cluster assembly transcription factor
MFSKACEYAIRATLYVAEKSLEGRRVSLKDIAEAIDSPVAFTAKILQQLVRNHVMISVMGPTGGFEIERKKLDTIKLSQIVDAIDGNAIYRGCGLGLKECNAAKPCPVHDKFVKIRDDLKDMLENTSLYELATGLEIGLTFLKR